MIYVNGDSHSAGADIIPGICFANDDKRYLTYGRQPHPEALISTYGYQIAIENLNTNFHCDAQSGSSNSRILRTSKQFVKQNPNCFVIIGWTSWEREEWNINGEYYQLSAGGIDSVPKHIEDDYKAWIIRQTSEVKRQKSIEWENKIWQFHIELLDRNIKHLFFCTRDPIVTTRDWGINLISFTYNEWCKHKGFISLNNNHYGKEAHTAWGNYLTRCVTAHYTLEGAGAGCRLTNEEKHSIVKKLKAEFKGLKNGDLSTS